MDPERYKKYFYTNKNNFSIDNIDDYYGSGKGEKRAVNMAFNDMAARTLKKVSDDEGAESAGGGKETALVYLRDAFYAYFHNGGEIETVEGRKSFDVLTEEGFDEWHKAVCTEFLTLFNEDNKKRYQPVAYGKAQKAVNMVFKYLYCYDGAEKYINEGYFAHCHMALDNLTLNWYKKEVAYPPTDGAWSDLKYGAYIEIQTNIRNYLEGSSSPLPSNALEAEFYVWQRERYGEDFKELAKALAAVNDDYLQSLSDEFIRSVRVGRERSAMDIAATIRTLDALKARLERVKKAKK